MASFSLPTPLPTTTDVFGSNEKFENVLDSSPHPHPTGKQNLCQEFPFKCASVTHTLTHLKKLKVVNVGLSVTQNIYIASMS